MNPNNLVPTGAAPATTGPKRRRRLPAKLRRASIALALVGALCLAGVVAASASRRVPNAAEGAPRISRRSPDGRASITWVGDTLLGDAAQPLIDRNGLQWPAARAPLPDNTDVIIANAEGPFTDRVAIADPLQKYSYKAQPRTAGAFAAMGIDAISLSNNHVMDYGSAGMDDTIANAGAAGIRTFGAGTTVEQARLPLMIETDVGTIGIVGFSDDSGPNMARADRPGVHQLNAASLADGVKLARRAGADFVVAHVQWGEGYAPVDDRQRAFAQAFVAAGYDLVIGLHPHVVQPVELIDGVPIIYSVGNYVFNTPGRFTRAAPGFGLVVTTEFRARGHLIVHMRCIETDNAVVAFQPRPCDNVQAQDLLGSLHPKVAVRGAVAKLDVPLRRR